MRLGVILMIKMQNFRSLAAFGRPAAAYPLFVLLFGLQLTKVEHPWSKSCDLPLKECFKQKQTINLQYPVSGISSPSMKKTSARLLRINLS